MPKINRINHVAILVDDIEKTLEFWRDALGISVSRVVDVPSEKSKVAFLPLGSSEVELVQPTRKDSGLARFLEKRGPGLHHICLEVDDIDGMLLDLKNRGIELINDSALIESGGRRYAFIHPKSAHGVMVELYQLPK